MKRNPGMRDLRGDSRRTFLKLVGAAGAAFALERSKVLNYLLDEGGTALADTGCGATNRSVHVIGGNGSVAWFQLLWPHIEVAQSNNAAFAYHSFDVPGTLFDRPEHFRVSLTATMQTIDRALPVLLDVVAGFRAGER